jgi:hypothetical protein
MTTNERNVWTLALMATMSLIWAGMFGAVAYRATRRA